MPARIVTLLITATLLFAASVVLFADEVSAPVGGTGTTITENTNKPAFPSRCSLTYKDKLITAESILIKNNQMLIRGGVEFKYPLIGMDGERLQLSFYANDAKDQPAMRIYKISAQNDIVPKVFSTAIGSLQNTIVPIEFSIAMDAVQHAIAATAKPDEQYVVVMKNVILTSCPKPVSHTHFALRAKEIIIFPDMRFEAKHAAFVALGHRVINMPGLRGNFNNNNPTIPHPDITVGSSAIDGSYIGTDYSAAISNDVNLG